MQTLDVISINLWAVIASLLNLLLIFLIVKRFLYKPVRRMLDQRRASIDDDYASARMAKELAEADRALYEEKLSSAKKEAEMLIHDAVLTAGQREKEILAAADEKADGIRRQAEADALLTRQKSEREIKREIVDVSSVLASKLLKREVNSEDHEQLIQSFIEELRDDDDSH